MESIESAKPAAPQGKAAVSGECALCLEHKALRLSHVIPNAVFRRIKRKQGTGQLILLDDSESGLIRRSQETWPEHLLCADCERVIGSYEQYGLELLRGDSRSAVNEHAGGITFRVDDYARLKLFLVSLLWRAAVSRQPVFEVVILPDACAEAARSSLLTGKALNPLRLGCKMRRLTDTTGAEDAFSRESLDDIVIPPIPRLHDGKPYYTMLFVIEGFLLEFFVRSVPHKLAGQRGILTQSPVLFVPNRCLFKESELLKLLVSARAKYERGLVAFDDKD